jgi:hypothetical protein
LQEETIEIGWEKRFERVMIFDEQDGMTWSDLKKLRVG